MRRNRWILPAGGLASLLVLAAPLGAGTGAIPGGNLVQNPGAEGSPGSETNVVVPIAGWRTTGAMTAWRYGPGDRPDTAFAASISGGVNFFSGGNGGIAGTPTATQSVDVSAAAAEIDAGSVAATLSAFMGGYTVAEDLPQVDAVFYDAGTTRLGALRIGPVNRDDRNRLTTLLRRSAVANVPKTTRRIDVVFSVTVDNQGKNHAFVDNICSPWRSRSPAPERRRSTSSARERRSSPP
ncbi:MAG: hypothetical protein H0U08_08495 [Actinobacteria bacterium]|nr:hypothetical protein [Actinomycetota bacterium]